MNDVISPQLETARDTNARLQRADELRATNRKSKPSGQQAAASQRRCRHTEHVSHMTSPRAASPRAEDERSHAVSGAGCAESAWTDGSELCVAAPVLSHAKQ